MCHFIQLQGETNALVSSIVKLRLSRQCQACFWGGFFTKTFCAHKNTSQPKVNQQNKNKLTLNNKGNSFLRAQSSKRVKVTCFAFQSFLCARNLFVKKINKLEIVLITSLYYTTEIYCLVQSYKNKIKTTRKSLEQKQSFEKQPSKKQPFKKQPSKKKPITAFYDHIQEF